MKITPSVKEFTKFAKDKNLIVFSCKLYCDYLTPVSIYSRVSKSTKKESFLLESVEGEEKISRFSFIGFNPLATFKSKGEMIYTTAGRSRRCFNAKGDPLFELKKFMSKFSLWPRENIRFFGGFVGYLGYDVVRFYEPIKGTLNDELDTFDSYFVLPKFLIIFDHLKKQVEFLSFLHLKDGKNLKRTYNNEIKHLRKLVDLVLIPVKLASLELLSIKKRRNMRLTKLGKIKSNFKKKDFIKAVKKTKQYIKEGEIIQAVISQRFTVKFISDPFIVYRYLRLLNPSPYMYYLNFMDIKIAGSSPEMLLRCENNNLTTRPIAGTRRRGRNDKEDFLLAKELLGDKKERAEHIMLVDLGRNDLGRVAKEGSVEVPVFMDVEKFSHVMHIVSEVKALLSRGQDTFSALKACFPAGTVSGAPKVRAMQIINQLEPDKRGIYAGCIGYFSFTKSLDTCIIIRTIIFKDNKAYIQAGAGIVADSKPLAEYQETVNKAFAQMAALELAIG